MPDATPSPSAAQWPFVRGEPLPDYGRHLTDCQGRFGDGSVVDHMIDSTRPSGLPQDPNVTLEKYFAEQRRTDRPDAAHYTLANFERHDSKAYGSSTDPAEVSLHGRWIGYRPDGSIFAAVFLYRAGTDRGWVLEGDEGCSKYVETPESAQPGDAYAPR